MNMKSEADMIVAILHDVLEKSPWTLVQLDEEGFSEEILRCEVSLQIGGIVIVTFLQLVYA
jgi:hypothetical protein